ncbi:hypothetical protein HNR46_001964 [Haloferula luteola]|uniref:Uncharacterized protein n=1 Tax=Haloferula luteola TaxID=595692 RepID=A0A840V158_9BACT|nr:hypothetical protein [Haloferula luteola]
MEAIGEKKGGVGKDFYQMLPNSKRFSSLKNFH